MSIIWIVIVIALVIVWALTIVDIVKRRLGTSRTAAWLLIVVLLPFAGALAYWLMRKPDPEDAERAAAALNDRREQAGRRPFDSTGFGP